MTKKIFSIALVLAMEVFCDEFHFNTSNNSGSLGVINIPSARFYDAPAASLSFYRGNPDRKITLSLYPYDWLEASVFYSSLDGVPYGKDFSQDYKDKGFNIKFRLKEQDSLPALAIGINDLGGTGYYSGEYIVSSYAHNNFDFHLGLGWGNLNHFNHFKNPLSIFSDKFDNRGSELGKGGTFNIDDFFSGQNASIFAGINYALNDNYVLKLEYDPLVTPGKVGYDDRNSDLSVGLVYLDKNYVLGANLERGSTFSFNISLRDDFFIPERKYKKITTIGKDHYLNLIRTLNMNQIGTSRIVKDKNATSLTVTQNIYNLSKLEEILEKSIEDSGLTEEIIVSYKIAGLDVVQQSISDDIEEIYNNEFKGFNQQFSINLRPFIAGREDFLKAAILLEHDAEFIFSENLFFSTNLKLSVIDNFDDLIYPPVDTYPAQVRSDVKKYLNNLGDKPSIGRAQVEYFKTLFKNNHILLSGGIYEEMFSGYGIEYLNYAPERKINWGFEAHKVYKRDYEFGFGLLDYENITHHINFFYKNSFLFPVDFKISYGEYLAGDKGATIEISRSFENGIQFGLFASRTDVSFDQFGEGSFDKGIFFKVPFGRDRRLSNFLWRPLTKDPASKLIRKNDIYTLVNKYSKL